MKTFPTIVFIALLVSAASAVCAPAAKENAGLPARLETIRVSEKRSNLLLFQAGDQVAAGNIGKSELTAIGAPGTVISTDDGRVVLHTGRFLVLSGKAQLDVGMRLGTVRLSRDSSAVIEVRPGKPVRIMCTGGRAAPAKIRTRGRLGQVIWLRPGEELVISDRVMPADAHVPPDGIERRALPIAAETRGLELGKNSFKLAEFIKSEVKNPNTQMSLACAPVRRLISNMVAAATITDPQFRIHLPPASPVARTTSGADPVHILASGGSEFSELPDGSIALRKGSLFVHPSLDVTVKTELAQLQADKDSLFSVETDSGVSRIAAFSGPGDLHLIAGSRKFDLSPGQEVLITDHGPTQEETSPRDGIGRRRLTTTKVREDLFVSCADVSIVTLINSAGHLRPLRQPSSSAEKRILERLVRTAAALDTTTRSRGPYRAQPRTRPAPKSAPNEQLGPASMRRATFISLRVGAQGPDNSSARQWFLGESVCHPRSGI